MDAPLTQIATAAVNMPSLLDQALLGQPVLAGTALLLLAAGLHDIASRWIPNRISACLAVIGLGLQLQAGSLAGALLAFAIVAALATFAWLRGWMGGGDVKLLAACALLVPPALVPSLVLAIALSGGLLSLLYIALSALLPRPAPLRPASRWARILRVEQRRIRRHTSLPYASAIAAGTLFVLFNQSSVS